ncbi:MAG TPA: tetratricopeptide repeat protein [Candidatus Binatia bacterium]
MGPRTAAWPLRWLLPVFVALLTVVFFYPTLENGFVDWDDDKIIFENLNYRGLDWPELRWMSTTFYMGHYQPLSWMTLGLDYLLWGMDPFGYHLTSLILHAANAVIFYFIALRLLSAASPGAAAIPLRVAALFAALVFAVHPLRVESVAWVTERRDVLSGLFLLLCILCYLKSVAAAANAERRLWMASAVVVYGLSLLSKAAGMTLPAVLLVLDVYPLRRLGGRAEGWRGPAARKVWWEKAPFALLAVIFAVVALLAQREARALLSLETHGVAARFGQALFGIAFYLRKTIAPLNLSPIYGLPIQLKEADWLSFLLSGALALALTVIFVIGRRRWPAALASWICYLALLAPVLGLVQAGPQLAADRYTYLACLGWAILAGGVLLYLWPIGSDGAHLGNVAVFSAVLAAVIVAILGFLTWTQTQVWHDPLTLWKHAVSTYPQASRAHNNFGNALAHRERTAEAIAHYREALRIDPEYKEAHHNLGITLASRGDLAAAIEQYRAALRIDPNYKEARNNLGVALTYQEKLPEAVGEYRAALRIDPGYKEVHNNLGVALVNQGELTEAIAHYRAALSADPSYKAARYNLGNALADRGEVTAAIEQYREALRIDPGYEEARNNLNVLLEMQGKK